MQRIYIRSRHGGERHLEVRVGDAETPEGGRRVFGAVAKGGTDVVALIRRTLDAVGRPGGTEPTAFTDGYPGLRSIESMQNRGGRFPSRHPAEGRRQLGLLCQLQIRSPFALRSGNLPKQGHEPPTIVHALIQDRPPRPASHD